MLSPQALTDAIDIVAAADFYKPAHGELFDAFVVLRAAERPVDAITVANHLGVDCLQRLFSGGAPHLHTLMAAVPTAANAGFYAEIVREKAVRRRLGEAGTRIVQLAGDAGTPLEDVLDRVRGTADAAVRHGARSDDHAAVLVPIDSVQSERLQWLWEGRLPRGKLVTLDGDPSVGKSTLAVDIAARISRGEPWPDGASCKRGDVLILSAEDGLADTIRPRLDAAKGDPARVHALTAVRSPAEDGSVIERPPTLADIPAIRAAIVRTQAVLVIIDVLMAYLPGKVDSHKDQDVRGVLSRITKLGDETGASFLLLRHLNKAGGSSPMYRGGGSIGIVGAARAGFLVARDPDDPDTRVLACVKSNLARDPESLSYRLEGAPDSHVAHVVWTGASTHDAAGLLCGAEGDGEEPDGRTNAVRWLTDYFTEHGGAAKASDVMKAAKADDIAERTLRRARDRIGARVERKGFGQGAVWTYDPTDTT